jgi:hypothetical protein
MIVATFDYGWGPELQTKKLEAEILRSYLLPYQQDDSCTVIINSTWYGRKEHEHTMVRLHEIRPDRIVLVSMIDAANCWPSQFAELGAEVRCVGYYDPPDDIDYWAITVDRYFSAIQDDFSAVDTAYMCLNRKPHRHRQALYDALISGNLLDRGIVSMGARSDGEPAQRSLAVDVPVSTLALNPNAGTEQTGIVNDIMSLGHPDHWRRIFLNIVTETQFDIQHTGFVSEKIYKPILGMRPFLVYARDGAIAWLTQRGFEPYVHDFQDITDLDLSSYHNTVPFLQILCAQPPAYWQKRMVDLRPKLLYNRNRFDRYTQEIKDKIHKGISCQI